MKKITLVLVTLALTAGMAVAEDLVMSVTGSAEVSWSFAGQLIDNTGSFLDESVPSGDFTSDGGDLFWGQYPELALTATIEDADGNVIVEAASEDYAVGLTAWPDPDTWDDDFDGDEFDSIALDYINFPNVIPGVLGIKLAGDDALEPDYAPSGSASENERILVNITPMGDMLDVTVGLLIKPDNKLHTTYYKYGDPDGDLVDDWEDYDDFINDTMDGWFVWDDDGDYSDLDDLDDGQQDTLDANPWETGTYLSWAASLEATFTAELGDEDEIAVGFGTVIDSAFTNGVYEPDTKVTGTDYTYDVFADDSLLNDAGDEAVVEEMYGAITVNPLTMKEMDPASYGSADEAKMLRTNEVLGRATIPIGVGVDADVAGITADIDFQTVLVEGKDTNNFTGIVDLTDPTKSTLDYTTYAMPIFFGIDVGYELEVADITITPAVNFKYSSDFWKWTTNDDLDGFEYDGDVSGADFVGRPMSLDIGVDVEGIADMIDVGISAAIALGDGVAGYHGLGVLPIPTATYTHDTGVAETIVYDNTVAELIDFWLAQPTLADADTNYWTAGTDKPADSASDGQNNGFFASTASAMEIEVEISAEVMDGLTITNTTSYEIDNAGIGGADDITLWGAQLSSLANETVIEYAWMVGDATAFTIFGEFTYESVNYVTEMGQKYVGLRGLTADAPADVFEFDYSEAPSMATFDYEVGVKVAVGL
jgi:hypothetical protein